MSFLNKIKFNNRKFLILIILLFISVTGGTYAYLYSESTNDNTITGDMATVDLSLDVIRVLPTKETVNSVLLFQFNELADNLNKGCINEKGDFSLCQLYKINLKNNNKTNVRLKGSLAFNNETLPNLSWLLLGNTYSSSTNYTSSMLGSEFKTATSTHENFVDNYLLKANDEIDFYILLWVNEIDRVQYDSGNYTGVVKFEDYKGQGVTAWFGDA